MQQPRVTRFSLGFIISAAVISITTGCASSGSSLAQGGIERDHRIIQGSEPEYSVESELIYQVLAGELAGHAGAIEEAVDHYSEATKISKDPMIARRATRIALYAGNNERALESAKRWVKLSPESLESHQTLAILFTRNAQSKKAIPHFEYVIKTTQPNNKSGFQLIGATLAREKNQVRALEVMRMLVERHPNNASAHFSLGNLALGAQHYQLAVEEGGKALMLDPELVEARSVRARAYMALGETEQALDDMKSAVRIDPDNYELRVTYARMLVQAKRYALARMEFNRLIQKRPGDTDLIYTLGLLNLQEQKYDAAIENFNQLVQSGKRVDEGYYYLGRVAEEREQFKEAIEWYLKLEKGDYLLDGQVRIAEMLVKMGSLKKAREHFKKVRSASTSDEDSVKLYLAEGQLLRETNHYHAGMQIYNRALTEYPGNEDLLYARALMAEKIDRIDLLEADLREILARDPENATALNALGYTLADRNERIEEAFGYIQRALKVRPDDPTVIDSMGWVQFRMGNYEAAEQYLRRAFKLMQDAEIAGHLSELIWAKGNKAEALDLLRQALEKDPQHEYLRELHQRFLQE